MTRITADKARALRDARTPGAWDAGAVRVYAGHDSCPKHKTTPPTHGQGCTCRAIADVYEDGDRALCAAAPDLADTVIDVSVCSTSCATRACGRGASTARRSTSPRCASAFRTNPRPTDVNTPPTAHV